MGCNQVKSEDPKQNCVFTEKQYLEYMLEYIEKRDELCLVLDKILFVELKSQITQICWPYEDKAALARLLEDYIRFSIQETYDISKKHTKYNLLEFGRQFGEEVGSLKLAVEQKNRDILKTLDFYKNFQQFYFQLSANTEAEQNKIHNTVLEISKMSQSCTEAYFYLTLILVRGCRELESQNIPMGEINKKLEEVVRFINNDFMDTPETELDPHNLMIYHQFRAQEYEKIPSKVYDTKFEYKKVTLTGDDKEDAFQNQIMELVEEAKKQFQYFERLLHKIIQFYAGYKFKINFKLKYREDLDALERIKQKILSKQNIDFNKDTQLNYRTIDQLLVEEKKLKKEQINRILNQNPTIVLSISDLLRARCTFSSIQNVNQAAEKIIQKIERQRKRGYDIELLEIDNRFKKITNDLVLKIRLGKTVTQFQMTFTAKNVDSFKYEIYHKVYQIGRSKMLSSISMLFNWYEKIAISYIKFLSKVINHPKTLSTSEQKDLFERLKDENDVCDIIEREMKNTNGDRIPLKNDIVSILIADKNLDMKKVEQVKEGTYKRTSQYFEKVRNYSMQYVYLKKILELNVSEPKKTIIKKRLTELDDKMATSQVIQTTSQLRSHTSMG